MASSVSSAEIFPKSASLMAERIDLSMRDSSRSSPLICTSRKHRVFPENDRVSTTSSSRCSVSSEEETSHSSGNEGSRRGIRSVKPYFEQSLQIVKIIQISHMLDKVDDDMKRAIVVPLGGTTADGKPQSWVVARLREATRLYAEYSQRDKKYPQVFLLSHGTLHKPLPIVDGYQLSEASAASKWLLENTEIEAENIFEEDTSCDTIGNFFFLRAQHFEYMDISSVTIVTCDWHMPRVQSIAEHILSIDRRIAMPMEFVACTNTLQEDAANARREKEARSLCKWELDKISLPTMRNLHRFIFRDHDAYSARRHLQTRQKMDDKLLQSY